MSGPARVPAGMVAWVHDSFETLADPARAKAMAVYMKTSMPFYGVSSPKRRMVFLELKRRFPPATPDEYRSRVLGLWQLPHREEKYLAIDFARGFRRFITFEQVDLYRLLIEEGGWWDLVDPVAADLVGRVVLLDRQRMRPVLEDWIEDDDLWLRRAALLCQLRHEAAADREMLFDFCRRRAHEREFFIRKAIGWALRQYARTDPEGVRGFLAENQGLLSGLSRREASKHL
jgi:3-methyladenine DNA glycosylase AlkD